MVALVSNDLNFIGNFFLPLAITHNQPWQYDKHLNGHDMMIILLSILIFVQNSITIALSII